MASCFMLQDSDPCTMLVKTIMEKVTVIGTGLTGAVTAALLRKELPESCVISLLDKSRGAGGRMSTSRGPSECDCSVDLGAQYITATPHYYDTHKDIYSELQGLGLLKSLTGHIEGDRHASDAKHFVAPHGISSVVKHFIKTSGADVQFNHQVLSCERENGRWKVTAADGTSSMTDCLVLTMPVPQILGLNGSIKSILDSTPDVKEKLEAVKYSSRYALGMFYKPGTTLDVPWCAKYINDKVVRFISIDTKKRDQGTSLGGTSVVVHASVPFSLQHLEEDKDVVCSELIMPRARKLLPELPAPDAVKNHKWRFSQVHEGYAGSPRAVLLHSDPPLILAGDAFVEAPRFDGCIDSAGTAVELVKQASKL